MLEDIRASVRRPRQASDGAARRVERIRSVAAAVDGAMGIAGGALFFVTAWYIVFDVIGRNYTGFYSGATDELSGYALAVGTTWAMGFTLRRHGHVAIDLLTVRLPASIRNALALIALLGMAFFAGVLAWFTWRLAIGSYAMQATSTGMIGTPLFLPQSLMALGLSALAVDALLLFTVGLIDRRRAMASAGSREVGAIDALD